MKHMLMLQQGETFTLPDAPGAVLRVVSGRVWITQDRDPRDIMLDAGTAWTIDRRGLAVVEAQNDASVLITGPVQPIPVANRGPHIRGWLENWLNRGFTRHSRQGPPYF